MSDSSAAQPVMSESSDAAPPTYAVFAWNNGGWLDSRFSKPKKHEETLYKDLRVAMGTKAADTILFCECGDIGDGLGHKWLEMVRRCCGPGFVVTHQSHYTSIVRKSTVEVLEGPSLKGPLCREHDYRMCQHLKVRLRDSAAKPIDLFNLHSPTSTKRPLTATTREQILKSFFFDISGSRSFFGGRPELEQAKLGSCLQYSL